MLARCWERGEDNHEIERTVSKRADASIDKSLFWRPETNDHLAEDRAAEEQAAQDRIADEHAAEEQAAEDRIADEHAAEEQAAEDRIAEAHAAEEQAAEERAAQVDRQAAWAVRARRSAKELQMHAIRSRFTRILSNLASKIYTADNTEDTIAGLDSLPPPRQAISIGYGKYDELGVSLYDEHGVSWYDKFRRSFFTYLDNDGYNDWRTDL